jgi:hypothetical protein
LIPLPTVAEVVAALKPFGVSEARLPGELIGPRGPTPIVCLERQEDGELYLSQSLPEENHMPWSTFFSICRQLHVDPEEVHLSVPRPPTWWMGADGELPAN